MMATSHRHARTNQSIMAQEEDEDRIIGDGAWIGTRALILPGVEIGYHSILGEGAVVTKSAPSSIIGGVSAKFFKSKLDQPKSQCDNVVGTANAL